MRAKVKIHEDGLGSIYLLQGNSMQHLIQYRDREILDLNGDVIGNYTPLEWVSIKFRFKYNYSDNTVIDYWINDEYICSSNRVIISSPNIYQGFICFMCGLPSSGAVGQVWYDDLELYSFSWPGFIWPLTE